MNHGSLLVITFVISKGPAKPAHQRQHSLQTQSINAKYVGSKQLRRHKTKNVYVTTLTSCALLKIIFLISQPKNMLWVLKNPSR